MLRSFQYIFLETKRLSTCVTGFSRDKVGLITSQYRRHSQFQYHILKTLPKISSYFLGTESASFLN